MKNIFYAHGESPKYCWVVLSKVSFVWMYSTNWEEQDLGWGSLGISKIRVPSSGESISTLHERKIWTSVILQVRWVRYVYWSIIDRVIRRFSFDINQDIRHWNVRPHISSTLRFLCRCVLSANSGELQVGVILGSEPQAPDLISQPHFSCLFTLLLPCFDAKGNKSIFRLKTRRSKERGCFLLLHPRLLWGRWRHLS